MVCPWNCHLSCGTADLHVVCEEHELSCPMTFPCQLSHLCRSPSRKPPGHSSSLRALCQPAFPSSSLWSLCVFPPLTQLARKRLTGVTLWDLIFLSQQRWPGNSSACIFAPYSSSPLLMLLSSHQFLCLLSTLSVGLLLPVLSCALLLPGQGQVPRLPHITVLVAHSLLSHMLCS